MTVGLFVRTLVNGIRYIKVYNLFANSVMHNIDDEKMKKIAESGQKKFRIWYYVLYFSSHSEQCCLSPLGMLSFSEGMWDKLVQLSFSNINDEGRCIGNMGCKYLSRANLPHIQHIYISKDKMNKVTAVSTRWELVI
jgi:hypothetical protein